LRHWVGSPQKAGQSGSPFMIYEALEANDFEQIRGISALLYASIPTN
jgi:hypothetical protein